MKAAPAEAQTIPVECAGWVTRFIGGNGGGRRIFDEPLAEPATVRSVLRGLTNRYPELAEALSQMYPTSGGGHHPAQPIRAMRMRTRR